MKNCNHLRNWSTQSEKSGQSMREQKYSHWRKQFTDIPRREKKGGLRTKMKSFRSGYSDQEVSLSILKFSALSPNLMNLSCVRLKSWNMVYNFKWNRPYLSRLSNLSRGSNSSNSASDKLSQTLIGDVFNWSRKKW